MSKPVETLYATVDRETLRQLQADSDELARIKAEHPIQKCLRENGELIALQATVAQQAKLIEALKAQPARQVGDEFEMPEGVTVSKDVMGTAHIQIGDFDFIQVQYQWPYIDNASQNRLVQQIVNLLAQQQEGEGHT